MTRRTGEIGCALRACAIILLISVAHGSIDVYNGDQMNRWTYRSESVFARSDAPASGSPGDGRAEVSIDLKLSGQVSEDAGADQEALVEAYIAPRSVFDSAGYRSSVQRQRYFCCTEDLAALLKCNVGRIIRGPDSSSSLYKAVRVSMNGTADIKETLRVQTSDIYYVLIAKCDDAKPVTMSGKVAWVNPYGFLNGYLYGNIPLYGILCALYIVFAFLWLWQTFRFLSDTFVVQYFIALLVFLAMIEVSTKYAYYQNFNSSGIRSAETTGLSIFINALRMTTSLVLLLLVSMGLGILRPTLGDVWRRIVAMASAHFIAAAVFTAVSNLSHTHPVAAAWLVLSSFPISLLNAIFLLWIFTSLSRSIKQCESRKQTLKLEVFLKLRKILVVAAVVSIMWFSYVMYYTATDAFVQRWRTYFIIDGFWDVLYFAVLAAIAHLWRPRKNSLRFAYSEVPEFTLEDDDDEEEGDVMGTELRRFESGSDAASHSRAQGVVEVDRQHDRRQQHALVREAIKREADDEESRLGSSSVPEFVLDENAAEIVAKKD